MSGQENSGKSEAQRKAELANDVRNYVEAFKNPNHYLTITAEQSSARDLTVGNVMLLAHINPAYVAAPRLALMDGDPELIEAVTPNGMSPLKFHRAILLGQALKGSVTALYNPEYMKNVLDPNASLVEVTETVEKGIPPEKEIPIHFNDNGVEGDIRLTKSELAVWNLQSRGLFNGQWPEGAAAAYDAAYSLGAIEEFNARLNEKPPNISMRLTQEVREGLDRRIEAFSAIDCKLPTEEEIREFVREEEQRWYCETVENVYTGKLEHPEDAAKLGFIQARLDLSLGGFKYGEGDFGLYEACDTFTPSTLPSREDLTKDGVSRISLSAEDCAAIREESRVKPGRLQDTEAPLVVLQAVSPEEVTSGVRVSPASTPLQKGEVPAISPKR